MTTKAMNEKAVTDAEKAVTDAWNKIWRELDLDNPHKSRNLNIEDLKKIFSSLEAKLELPAGSIRNKASLNVMMLSRYIMHWAFIAVKEKQGF